jgi:hypothetical protein
MKKTILMLFGLIFVLVIQGCGGLTSGDDDDGDGDGNGGYGTEKWTYMVYVAGTNSLSDFAALDLAEMQSVGSNEDVAIVVQYENYYDCTTRYYLAEDEDDNAEIDVCDEEPDTCTYDGDELSDDVDMGDPASLTDFIEWAIGNYPADNYVLVLWDHGSGWRNDGSHVRALSKGALQDDHMGAYDTCMSIPGIAGAIADAEESTGETIDIVRFDACLMGMYEVAYELQDVTSYLVASEEVVPGDGDPYDTILEGLKDDPDMTPAELAEYIVDRYGSEYADYSEGVTNSAIDMSKVEALNSAITALAAALASDISVAQDASIATQEYSTSNYADSHDIYDFATYLVDNSIDAGVVAAAQTVQTAVADAVISHVNNGGDVADSHGLAIFLPGSADEIDEAIDYSTDLNPYSTLACNNQEGLTTWWDFVETMW